MKKFLIVFAECYRELSEALASKINEYDKVNALAISIVEYAANEITPSEKCPILFVGDCTENPYTAFYYPKLAFRLKNECGAFYGGDKTRMLIFGDGDLSHRRQLKVIFDKQKNGDIEQIAPKPDTHIRFLPFALISYTATFSLILPILSVGGMFLFGKTQQKKIRYLQVLLGMDRLIEAVIN